MMITSNFKAGYTDPISRHDDHFQHIYTLWGWALILENSTIFSFNPSLSKLELNYQVIILSYQVIMYIIQVKEWLRLTTTVTESKPVLAMKNLLFERAGVPSFPTNLRLAGYEIISRNNTRLVAFLLFFCRNRDSF